VKENENNNILQRDETILSPLSKLMADILDDMTQEEVVVSLI